MLKSSDGKVYCFSTEAPAKAIPQPKQGWSIGAGLVEKAGWRRRYYRHYRYYSRRYGYYPPPYAPTLDQTNPLLMNLIFLDRL
jgi:hypothetical protein